MVPIVGQILLIVFFAIRSDQGDNRFDPVPMAVAAR
ncbi:hypothetical protein BCF44_107222 [Kutzneria buriramensis]|uniref:DUF805 domain-containing protein n=1 Tax=Kutzneria buriramensis TaxID=1045776 RepID=A0A3E0HHX4_9PSEU|nr:hypothetical protein BCF44_107222 [Kutzneria buriramensis]